MKSLFIRFVLMFLVSLLIVLAFTCIIIAKEYEVAVVVKIAGIPWFNRLEEGVIKAGKELGVNSYMLGPSEADPAQQVKIVEDLIAKGVDVICVVPNDASAMVPVFERARQKGIVILTHESPSQKGADWDIETIDNKKFGEANLEKMAEHMGGEGEFAVFVGSLTVPLHNYWADVGLEMIKEKYPKMKLVTDRIPCAESVELSITRTNELLKAYPNLKGIVGFGSLGPIGASEAIKAKKLGGKVIIVGTVIPSHAANFLKEGIMQHGYLWDPADAGYALIQVAKILLDGGEIKDGMEFPDLGAATVDFEGRNIKFDKILDITAENADKLGF